MVTIEEKLLLFSKLLSQSMDLKYKDELNKLQEEYEFKILDSKKEIDNLARETEIRAIKKAEFKLSEFKSKSKISVKKEIMNIKEKYFNIFMKNFKERLIDFIHSIEYKTYLNKCIMKLNNQLKSYEKINLNIYLSTKDFNKYGDYIKTEISKKHSVSLVTKDIIGGFTAIIPSENIKFDLSIDAVLEENETYIMQLLFEALEAGEYND